MATSQKFLKDMKTLSDFLRMLNYGCYPRDDAELFGMSRRTYDDYLQLARFFLPEQHLAEMKVGKTTHVHFQGDAYHTSWNFLSRAYAVHAVSADAIRDYLSIMDSFHYLSAADIAKNWKGAAPDERLITQAADQLYVQGFTKRPPVNGPMRYYWMQQEETDVLKGRMAVIERMFPEGILPQVVQVLKKGYAHLSLPELQELLEIKQRHLPQIRPSSLNRRMQELVTGGFLQTRKEGKGYVYSRRPNPLAMLTAEERKALLYAIAFCQPRALITYPGVHLEARLARELSLPLPKEFIIKNNNFARILDDETLLTLLTTDGAVSFTYHGKKHTILPRKISTDFIYHRDYVDGQEQSGTRRYRIDQMKKVSPVKEAGKQRTSRQRNRERPVSFLLHGTEEQLAQLEKEVRTAFPDAVIAPAAACLSCRITCVDPLKLLPWLRTLYPAVELLPLGRHHLYEKEKAKLEEALKQYGLSI